MNTKVLTVPRQQLTQGKLSPLPVAITRAGEDASRRFIEFFTANIRNKNTRMAYMRALVPYL
jgi:hypothetical protein